jgi:hypothetical protein
MVPALARGVLSARYRFVSVYFNAGLGDTGVGSGVRSRAQAARRLVRPR